MAITQTPEGIVYEEHLSIWVRLFVGVIGLGMFFIPVPYIIHNDWTTFSFITLVAIAAIIAPVIFGYAVMYVALSGVRRMVFQNTPRVARQSMRWPFYTKTSNIAATRFRSVDLHMRDSEDGPYPILRITIDGMRPVVMANFGAASLSRYGGKVSKCDKRRNKKTIVG